MERHVLYADPDQDARERFAASMDRIEMDVAIATAGTIDAALEAVAAADLDIVVADTAFDEAEPLFRAASEHGIPSVAFTAEPFQDVVESGIMRYISAYKSKDADEPFADLSAEIVSLLQDRSELGYPVPDDEDDRLVAVERYDVDGLRDVESFDRLARIAQAHFDVDFCFVGLITADSEEFLAFQGSETERLERNCTICTFGIMDEGVLQVEDTRTDPRFRYVDAIHDLGIRWYAGMPLVTDDGHRVGMFCIADRTGTELSPADKEVLRLFADEAMDRMEMHRRSGGAGR